MLVNFWPHSSIILISHLAVRDHLLQRTSKFTPSTSSGHDGDENEANEEAEGKNCVEFEPALSKL